MADGNTIDVDEPAEGVDDPDVALAARPRTCGNGTPWLECAPCPACVAEMLRYRQRFADDVAAGTFDAKGYEPGDRGYGGQGLLFDRF